MALALLCVALWALHSAREPVKDSDLPVVTNIIEKIVRKTVEVPIERTVEVPRELSVDERNAIERTAVDKFRKQLASELSEAIPEEKRIRNFDKEKKCLPKIDDIGAEDKWKNAHDFLEKLKLYVTFFNTNTNLQENKDK